jgi:hypothetical protein
MSQIRDRHSLLKSATLCLNILEAAMDDDKNKNVVEKLVDKINDVVEKVVTTASDAAQHAMEPDPDRPDGQPVAYMPMAGDGFVSDPMLPAMMPIYAPKKRRPARKKAKSPAKKVAKRPVKTTDNKSRKLTTKKSKKPAKKSAKKTAKKKGAKKRKAKKSKR